jgi:hypothetical protein
MARTQVESRLLRCLRTYWLAARPQPGRPDPLQLQYRELPTAHHSNFTSTRGQTVGTSSSWPQLLPMEIWCDLLAGLDEYPNVDREQLLLAAVAATREHRRAAAKIRYKEAARAR